MSNSEITLSTHGQEQFDICYAMLLKKTEMNFIGPTFFSATIFALILCRS